MALVAFVVVASVVGVLVDILARQGIYVAEARTEAEGLARLAAEVLSTTPAALPHIADTLRNTFDLDTVALRARVDDAWHTEFAVGEPFPSEPEQSPFTAELADGRVLALIVNPTGGRDRQLLRSFINHPRLRREHDQLARLIDPNPADSPRTTTRYSSPGPPRPDAAVRVGADVPDQHRAALRPTLNVLLVRARQVGRSDTQTRLNTACGTGGIPHHADS